LFYLDKPKTGITSKKWVSNLNKLVILPKWEIIFIFTKPVQKQCKVWLATLLSSILSVVFTELKI